MLAEKKHMVEVLFIYLMLISFVGQIYCTFGLGKKWDRFLFTVGLEGLFFFMFYRVMEQLLR